MYSGYRKYYWDGRVMFLWGYYPHRLLPLLIFIWWAFHAHFFTNVIMLPRLRSSTLPVGWYAWFIFYWFSALMTILTLLRNIFTDPGTPSEREGLKYISALNHSIAFESGVSFCTKCCLEKAARTHHCRRCDACTTRLDHHCPWVNNCIGADNLWCFVTLMAYSSLLSHAMLVTLIVRIISMPNRTVESLGPADGLLVRYEFGVACVDLALVAMFAFAMTSMTWQYLGLIYLDRTMFDILMKPTQVEMLQGFRELRITPIQCLQACSKLFHTRNVFVWFCSPLQKISQKRYWNLDSQILPETV